MHQPPRMKGDGIQRTFNRNGAACRLRPVREAVRVPAASSVGRVRSSGYAAVRPRGGFPSSHRHEQKLKFAYDKVVVTFEAPTIFRQGLCFSQRLVVLLPWVRPLASIQVVLGTVFTTDVEGAGASSFGRERGDFRFAGLRRTVGGGVRSISQSSSSGSSNAEDNRVRSRGSRSSQEKHVLRTILCPFLMW